MERIVLALGGNALLTKGEEGFQQQLKNAKKTATIIADILERGFEVIVTHGNGRQVGSLLLQSDMARQKIPPTPLHVAVAETQGQIGYALQQTLRNELVKRELEREVATVVTQVQVVPDDPAFENPTKYVGPYYSKKEAKKLKRERGWAMKEDPRGGWRRVVPSPDPKAILEKETIKELLTDDAVVIAVGGGGVPVIWEEEKYHGVDAVIDKDLASALLADEMNADKLVILTDVEQVKLHFGTPKEEPIDRMSVEEARTYYDQREFKAGSMGPKVKGGIQFVRRGEDRRCVIAHLTEGYKAVDEEVGTIIYSK